MFTDIKLLIVDDSPINHRVVSLSLRGQISNCESAFNGQQAIDMYKEKKYDVILMDVTMPVMDGFHASEIIRKYEAEQGFDKKVLIVAMTANVFCDDVKKCLEAGMDSFLGKPFSADEFLKILEEKLQ